MTTQEDIDRPEPTQPKRTWRQRFFRKALDVGPKQPKLSRDEWEFVAYSLRMIADDNAEVIGTFGDPDLDAKLTDTAERAWALANRIDEELAK